MRELSRIRSKLTHTGARKAYGTFSQYGENVIIHPLLRNKGPTKPILVTLGLPDIATYVILGLLVTGLIGAAVVALERHLPFMVSLHHPPRATLRGGA